jgi:polynucleotide 5'-triphosphatase
MADLLQGKNFIEKEHELELELSAKEVREQGNRARSGEKHEYLALIEGMVDNIRLLARTVPRPFPR